MTINDLQLAEITYLELYQKIESALMSLSKILITYTTANSLNLVYESPKTKNIFQKFDIIHPDGFGVFLASKILYGKNGFKNRFTGSDFYPILIRELMKSQSSIFFLGDTIDTLNRINVNYPALNVVGFSEGFNYNTYILLEKLNYLKPDVIIVGMGSPKQEEWIVENNEKVNARVFLAVGDGIKVFAGTKVRGPKFLQKIGMEWFVRLLENPINYWKRYILGIPLFLFRIIILKIKLTFK